MKDIWTTFKITSAAVQVRTIAFVADLVMVNASVVVHVRTQAAASLAEVAKAQFAAQDPSQELVASVLPSGQASADLASVLASVLASILASADLAASQATYQ